ncbi:GntR family transcriptional regulator [Microtetraspora sp. AC03309]|uniref:GntR family transcriptional regulator n=1 Tax=Microtetraspora sp. AC03309 TaxID=2779376 RepID=UPI001E606FA8|nr:GntR family transcriptional regulator [Microtetraspora sp. AC03309]MCC5578355.1 GntR family transcriptional regulator [Microtetraspora sp. AC03309]
MTETFLAPDRPFRTKAELAAEHIKQMIMSGQTPPGAKIITRVVAEAVGVSDTPVREAIKQLVSEEWLVERPHIGAVVAEFTVANVRELYSIRAALTSLALELHAAPLSGARLVAVDEVLTASARAIADGDVAAFARLNRRYHSLLCDTEESRIVHRMLQGLWAKTETAQRGFRLVPWRLPHSHAEHMAIRDALVAGDIARASELQHAHEMAAMDALIHAMDGNR